MNSDSPLSKLDIGRSINNSLVERSDNYYKTKTDQKCFASDLASLIAKSN